MDNYACFDTIFDQDLPEVASIYPLPKEIRDQGVHRYGFHGLSCESILHQFQDGRVPNLFPPAQIPERMIYAHLGSGASVTAIRNGKALDTSMGLTPCGGVLMGTRSGDLDPGLILLSVAFALGQCGQRNRRCRADAEQAFRHVGTLGSLE